VKGANAAIAVAGELEYFLHVPLRDQTLIVGRGSGTYDQIDIVYILYRQHEYQNLRPQSLAGPARAA
jgi:hypothetical protein